MGIAALLYGKVERLGKHVAVVVSGGNVDLALLLEIAQNHSQAQVFASLGPGSDDPWRANK